MAQNLISFSFASFTFEARYVLPPWSGWFWIINFLCAANTRSLVAEGLQS